MPDFVQPQGCPRALRNMNISYAKFSAYVMQEEAIDKALNLVYYFLDRVRTLNH